MNNKDYDHIRDYQISKKVNSKVRILISDFAILWNRYEDNIYTRRFRIKNIDNNYLNESYICQNLKEMKHYIFNKVDFDNIEKEISDLYQKMYDYFNIRNFDNSFDVIAEEYCIKQNNPNTAKCYDRLEYIFDSEDIFEQLEIMLIIIRRVRNNMFHGKKLISVLNEQEKLFDVCNRVLTLVLYYYDIPID